MCILPVMAMSGMSLDSNDGWEWMTRISDSVSKWLKLLTSYFLFWVAYTEHRSKATLV